MAVETKETDMNEDFDPWGVGAAEETRPSQPPPPSPAPLIPPAPTPRTAGFLASLMTSIGRPGLIGLAAAAGVGVLTAAYAASRWWPEETPRRNPKSAKKRKKWVAGAQTRWSPPEGLYGTGSAVKIAQETLDAHDYDLRSSVSSIQFYINRNRSRLGDDEERWGVLHEAKDLIRAYGLTKQEQRDGVRPAKVVPVTRLPFGRAERAAAAN